MLFIKVLILPCITPILVVLVFTCSIIPAKSPSITKSSIDATLSLSVLNATVSDCPVSSNFIIDDLIVVELPFIAVTTLDMSNLPPEMLALSATISFTTRPSGTAPAFIPVSSNNIPTPSCENKQNVKLPVASFPICTLTFPF